MTFQRYQRIEFCPEIRWVRFGRKYEKAGQSGRLYGARASEETLVRLLQFGKLSRIGVKFSQCVSHVERDHSLEASPCRHEIMAGVVHCGEEPEHCRFGWFVTELDVMFRGIVETAFGSGQIPMIKKALAELAIGYCEPFFISDDPVKVEGLLERCDCPLPLSFTSLLQRQVVIENAECAVVLQLAQQIQRFEVIGAGFLGMVGADVEIAEIDQRVCNGVLIAFRALDRENFFITGFGAIQIAGLCADVAEIAEGIGEGAIILGEAIIRDRLFIGRDGLRQLAAMKKNASAMFMIVRHESALVRRREVCYGARIDGSHKLPTLRP